MLSPITILLLFLSFLTSSYHLYNLYQSPTTFANFTKNGLGNKAIINKILTPEQSDLIITIQSNDLLKLITISFYKVHQKSILLIHQSYKKIMYEIEFIDAFWVGNQYLLIIGPTRKIFYRPPINGHEESFAEKLEYSITFAGIVSESNGSQFTTLNTNLNKWVLHKYAITQNSSSLIKKIPLCNIRLLETPVQLIRVKDFQCVLFEKVYTLDKPQVSHRIQCLHLKSSIIDGYQEKDEIKAKVDYDRNAIYTLGGLILGEIVRYQLSLVNTKIQFKKQKLFAGLKDVRDVSFSKNIMTLYMIDLADIQRSYFMIISTSDLQRPYVYQYYQVEKSKYPVGMMKISTKDKELFIFAPTVINSANTEYDLIYTLQIEYQIEYDFVWEL